MRRAVLPIRVQHNVYDGDARFGGALALFPVLSTQNEVRLVLKYQPFLQ